MNDGKLLCVYVPFTPMTTTSGSPGIRYFEAGFSEFINVIGVDTITNLFSTSPPSTGTMEPPFATDPVPLPDGRVLFSYAKSVEQQDYEIYICDLDGNGLTPVFDNPITLELNAEVLIPKDKPPVIDYLSDYDRNLVPPTSDPSTFYKGGGFRFDCLNIYSNAPVDAPIDNAPSIQKNAKIKFFLNFQREDPNGLDDPILFREIIVDYDGKIMEGDMPVNVSMFEQLTDNSGNVIVDSKGNATHVMGFNYGISGSGTKCVGCHIGHTMITVPMNVTEGQFTNLSTSATVTESSIKENNPDYKGQNVVDRKARNKDLSVNWIATGDSDEYVELNWEIPIDVREFTIYDIFPNPETRTNIHVLDCEIFLYLNGDEVEHIPSTGELSYDGTSIKVTQLTKIDKAKFIIKNFEGKINNQSVAGLAEIETNARVSNYNTEDINNGSLRNEYKPEKYSLNPFDYIKRFLVKSIRE